MLCEQLSAAISLVTDVPVVNLYEFLSPHQHVTNDGHCYLIDREDSIARPDPLGIDTLRLARLNGMLDRIAVLKILTRDLHRGNADAIDRLIDGDHTYTICLNRADVANQILSYFIGKATGLWHSNQSGSARAAAPIWVSRYDMARLGEEIMLHYLWHAEMRDRFDATVWHDQLLTATYPGLLGHGMPLPASQERLNLDHEGSARAHITNASELIDFAYEVEASISSLRGMLS